MQSFRGTDLRPARGSLCLFDLGILFCGGVIIHVFDRSLASDENGIAVVGIVIIVAVRFRSLTG